MIGGRRGGSLEVGGEGDGGGGGDLMVVRFFRSIFEDVVNMCVVGSVWELG